MKIQSLLLLLCALPLQVSASNFFAPSEIHGASLSPGGDWVALSESQDDKAMVRLVSSNGGEERNVFDAGRISGAGDSRIVGLEWIDDRFCAISMREIRKGVAELADLKQVTKLYIVDIENTEASGDPVTYEVKTGGSLISTLPLEPGVFLYSHRTVNSRAYRIEVEKLNRVGQRMTRNTRIDGGQFTRANEVQSYKGIVVRWFANSAGDIESALTLKGYRDIAIEQPPTEEDGEWTELWSFSASSEANEEEESEESEEADANEEEEEKEFFFPLAKSAIDNEYFALRYGEDSNDALYRINVETGENTLEYQHAYADIFDVVIDRLDNTIRGVGVVEQGTPQFVYFGDDLKKAHSALVDAGSDGRVSVVESDVDRNLYLLLETSFTEPGTFYLWNEASGTAKEIGSRMPWLDGSALARLETGTAASHGMDIPYLLTLPHGDGTPLPLLLMPHGGPIGVVDSERFNPVTQYLAAEGFAVLQVNYRGSAGYGDAFEEAGKREWGGKILDDIVAALDDVLGRPDIDSDRVCIIGGSYGGYAALALGIQFPERFRCAGAVAAVSDVNLIAGSRTLPSKTREWVKEYIGDPAEEFEALAAISPANKVQDLRIPVFVAHGMEDTRVDVEHAYRMKYALRAHSKDFDALIVDDMGHNIEDPEQAELIYGSLVDFVRRNTQ